MPAVAETTWGVLAPTDPVKAQIAQTPKVNMLKVQPDLYMGSYEVEHKYHHERPRSSHVRLRTTSARRRVTDQKQPSPGVHGDRRPASAAARSSKIATPDQQSRPRSAFEVKRMVRNKDSRQPNLGTKEPPRKSSNTSSFYYQQLLAQRLSRPKTASGMNPSREDRRTKHHFRPKSAMSYDDKKNYLTTYEYEFPGYLSGMSAAATRPKSTKGFTVPYELSDAIGGTTCEHEFGWKDYSKTEPIRSGTSSGNRKNNPHPHESFMVWKLPNKSASEMITSAAPHLGYSNLNNRVLDQILRDQLKSTYQCDYLGIPQGYQVKEAIDAPPDWRTRISRPVNTTFRCSYGSPQQHPELVGNTTRYGCNKNKPNPALGAVPTVTRNHVRNQELIDAKTTYDVEFLDRHNRFNPDMFETNFVEGFMERLQERRRKSLFKAGKNQC